MVGLLGSLPPATIWIIGLPEGERRDYELLVRRELGFLEGQRAIFSENDNYWSLPHSARLIEVCNPQLLSLALQRNICVWRRMQAEPGRKKYSSSGSQKKKSRKKIKRPWARAKQPRDDEEDTATPNDNVLSLSANSPTENDEEGKEETGEEKSVGEAGWTPTAQPKTKVKGSHHLLPILHSADRISMHQGRKRHKKRRSETKTRKSLHQQQRKFFRFCSKKTMLRQRRRQTLRLLKRI